MKKILPYILLLFACTLLPAGCSDDKSDDLRFRITHSDVDFNAGGGTGTISFEGASTVSVKSDREWVKIDTPTSTSISFTVSPYEGVLSRSAMIEIVANDMTEVVVVTQMGVTLDIDKSCTVVPTKVSTVLDLYTNTTDVKVSSEHSWANVIFENGQLIVTPEPNPGAKRETTLTITSNWKTVKTKLIQLPFLEITETNLNGLGNPTSVTLHQSINAPGNSWSVKGKDSWVRAKSDGLNIIIEADKNETGARRKSTVTFTFGDINIPISVTQSGIVDHYKYFLGKWTLSYDEGKARKAVVLEKKEDNKSYTMKGLEFDVEVTYDKKSKQLGLTSQPLGAYKIYHAYLCPHSSAKGYYTWNKEYGLNMIFNGDEDKSELKMTDNGKWETHKVDGFIFYAFTESTPSENAVAGYVEKYKNVVKLFR